MMATTITVLNHKLTNALQAVRHCVASRAALPVLSHVRFTPSKRGDGWVELEATNLEQWIRVPLEAVVDGDLSGFPTLDYRFLTELCGKLGAERTVTLTASGERHIVLLRSDEAEYRLMGLDPAEFPPMPEPEEPVQTLKVNGRAVCKAVRRVLPATSKEEARPLLQAVRVEVRNPNAPYLRFVATDTHRLHITEDALDEQPIEQELAFHISAEHWQNLLTHWEYEPEVTLQITSTNKLIWTTTRRTGALLLLDGTYPNYERVIPQEHNWYFELPTTALTAAIQRLLLIAENFKIYLDYDRETQRLVLKTQGDRGDGREEVPVSDASFSESITICAINGKYLLDVLRAYEWETIHVTGEQPLRPIKIESDVAFPTQLNCAIVMPMAL